MKVSKFANLKVLIHHQSSHKMFCLISQPNNVIIEIRIDPKAIGQECLMKVGVYRVFIIIGN